MAMLRNLLLLFCLFSLQSAAAKKCPFGWKPFGVQCYKYFPQQVNWPTAEKNCQTIDGNLASVQSKLANDFLLSLVPVSSRAWIGGHDGEVDGQWMWTDGSVFDFTYWGSKEPNNDNNVPENCLEISRDGERRWNDEQCSTLMGFLCAQSL
ncbi:ladderlectin-like isoform X2 [Xyrauchen texanus]|uniref:ladderlectin-like isoform X1 n=1 Tax=Xyrauchen texanus TaxID=154827 RepID=UPI002241DFAB|nr:ladderlectin-like isoform X1 [Xyrauchen texanus]XP_051980254.1 ladderlectin-like isoform X2 [Xyrauchen texanus]